MNVVLDITFPVFGLALVGYLAARLGWFSERAAEGLAGFVFDFALPFMLVRVFAHATLPADVPWGLLASYYLPVLVTYGLGALLARTLLGLAGMQCVIAGFAASFGNLALVGLPLALRIFGEDGALPYFIVLSVHGLTLMTLTTLLLEMQRHREAMGRELPLRVLRSLVRNPFLVALAAGLVLNRTGVAIPGPLDHMAELMEQAVTPCALFSIGASLSRYHVAGALAQPMLLVVLKNLLLPLAVWFTAGQVFDLEPLWTMVLVLMAAQPMGVTVYLFAERYGSARDLATTAVFLSSVLSMVTLTLLTGLYRYAGVLAGPT